MQFQKNQGPESGGTFYRVPLNVGSKVAAKRIRSIQVQTATNNLIFKIGRLSQVQGSHGTKFEADRKGATEVKSHSIFEVSMWKCVKQCLLSMMIYGFDFPKYVLLFFTCFMTSPVRTDIFRPGGVKNRVLGRFGREKLGKQWQNPCKRRQESACKRTHDNPTQNGFNPSPFNLQGCSPNHTIP